MANRPDDFPVRVKRVLAERAGHRCSEPRCGQTTSGPAQLSDEKSINNGHAAHITAASEGGARYDKNMSSEERKSISNAIWMCHHHGHLVDKEDSAYTVEQLKNWKEAAELRAYKDLENSSHESEYTARDIRALEETFKILDYNAIYRLRNELFGATVERSVIEPVNWYIAVCDEPKYHFNNYQLELLQCQLKDQCEAFAYLFGQQCGGGPGDRFSFVNMSTIQLYNPSAEEVMIKYVYKVQSFARGICNTAASLLDIYENVR